MPTSYGIVSHFHKLKKHLPNTMMLRPSASFQPVQGLNIGLQSNFARLRTQAKKVFFRSSAARLLFAQRAAPQLLTRYYRVILKRSHT